MPTKKTTHRQRNWLKHVKAADLSDTTIAEYAAVTVEQIETLLPFKPEIELDNAT